MPKAASAKKPFDYGTPRFEDTDIDWLAARPWPKNAKAHDLAFLGEVFGENGFAEFPVFDEGSGKMVAGHGRVEKLVKMRDAGDPAPARVKVKDGKWLVPTIRGMTFPKPGKHVLASNRGVERGGWDNALLAAAFTSLGKDDLVGTGFGQDDFATFLATGLGSADDAKIDVIPLRRARRAEAAALRLPRDLRRTTYSRTSDVPAPRYFVLTAGATAHDAIDYVEARGHRVIATRLTAATSVALYGICEVEPPREPVE